MQIPAVKIKMRGKSFERYRSQFQDQQLQILYTDNANFFFYKFKYEDFFKIKNNPDLGLLGTSYLSN
jgi:hypothetical protein